MTRNIEIIVLNLTKIGEKSIVIHTISKEYGRRSFVMNAGKGSTMSLLSPMSILEASVTENPKTTLWRAGSIVPRHPLYGLRGSVSKNAMTMFMSEVLYRTIHDGAIEDGLYEWCEKAILTLDALDCDFSNFHLRFLLEFCVALGFSPSMESLRPFIRSGEPGLEPIFETMLSAQFSEFMLIPLNGESRNSIAEILLRYLSHHTESRIEVRSLKVLRELFS